MRDDLGVGVRREPVATLLQLPSQGGKVVDLAVEHHLHGATLVPDRLVPRLEVDDRQPAEAEAHRHAVVVLAHEKPLVVRPSVAEGCASS